MSHRALALVSALTVGDFWLWNWSLSGSRDVLALVSGLTLLPLAAACLLLIALAVARTATRLTRRSALAATTRRAAMRERSYRRSVRALSLPRRTAREPELALSSAHAGAAQRSDHGSFDDEEPPADPVGERSSRPASKLAA